MKNTLNQKKLILSELVQDILIAYIDNLKGFDEGIRTIYPNTEVQTCEVHQIRNSLKYVASKDQKVFMSELKLVYRADNEPAAVDELAKLKEKWIRNIRWSSVPGKKTGLSCQIILSILLASASLSIPPTPLKDITGR